MSKHYFYPKNITKKLYQSVGSIKEEKKQFANKKIIKMKATLPLGISQDFSNPLISILLYLLMPITKFFNKKTITKHENHFLNQNSNRFARTAKHLWEVNINYDNNHFAKGKKVVDKDYLKLPNKSFTNTKNILNKAFNLITPLFLTKGKNNQISKKSFFGVYAIFFMIIGLFPVFYVDEQSGQSLFLNWVQAKEPSISKSLYPTVNSESTLANSDILKVEIINSHSGEMVSPTKMLGNMNLNSSVDLIQEGHVGQAPPEHGSSHIEMVIDPNEVIKSLGSEKDQNIVNIEYSNETISEDNIGDWVDENDKDLFANSQKQKTLKKVDKVKQAFNFLEYTVTSGDSLWGLAKQFNVSIDSLISLNKITNPKGLDLGNKLKIPELSGIYYEVKKNDSLSKLSSQFGVAINDIEEYNDLGKYLNQGKLLFIPGAQYSRFQKDYIFGNLFINPVSGLISSKYGFRKHPIKHSRLFHTGIDIAKNNGERIRAAADGVVTKAGLNGNYGNYILIDHKLGYETAYAHLSTIWVKPGQKVKKGQFIGKVGNTGMSTGPHLHFEVKQAGKFLNPLRFVKY